MLPLHFIRQLNRPFQEKVVLFILLALGLLASGCGIAKVVLLKKSLETRDPVFDSATIVTWTYV
jgi:hypothetical protein